MMMLYSIVFSTFFIDAAKIRFFYKRQVMEYFTTSNIYFKQ